MSAFFVNIRRLIAQAINTAKTEIYAALDAVGGAALIGFIQSGLGAIQRTIGSKLRERVSVLDFGADPTGVNDSTAAFNAALVASLKVYAPAGRYLINGIVRMKRDGSSLFGDGWGSTVLFAGDTFIGDTTPVPILSVKSDTWDTLNTRIVDISVSDLTLTGRNGATLSDRDLLGTWGAGFEMNVFRVHLDGVKRRAVYAKDMWDTTFLGCRITHCGYSNIHHHAVLLDGDIGNSNAVRFIGCHFEGNATGAAWMRNSANQIFFIGNKFEGENAEVTYDDFHIFHAESGCSNIIFSANTVTANQKNPAKHWLYSAATSTQITGGTFQAANDLLGACLLKLEMPASLIGSKVVGVSFYADGSTAEYPFDLGGNVVFQANTITVVNPRKLLKTANGSTVADNTVVGKGTVNQPGDVFCYFAGSGSFVKDNQIDNTTKAVANNLFANFNEPVPEYAYVSVVSGFDPNQYRSGTVFSASAPITGIASSYHGKQISIQCGGANTITHNSGLEIVLAGGANFAPGGWGLINLVFVMSVGWVEESRMTWF